MADKRVSELPAAESIGDADLFVMEQGGEAKSITGAKIKSYNGKPLKKIMVAMTETMSVIDYSYQDGSSSADIITFDSAGYPTNIKANGVDIPVEWMVDDA
jgi:hypothetical protein